VHRVARLGCALAALIVAAAPAQAAAPPIDREDGFLTAYAYMLFPGGARMRLDPRDDAEEDLALVISFRRALERRGHIVDAGATLVLSFDLTIDDDIAPAAREGGASGGSVVVPIARGELRGRPAADASRYRLSVAVDDRRTGRRVWSAEALFAADYRGVVPTAQAMVPVLLDSLGQTVNRLSITFE
jgi:hypothetical protein